MSFLGHYPVSYVCPGEWRTRRTREIRREVAVALWVKFDRRGGVEGKLAKFERVGPNPDVPRPIDVPNHVPVGGPQYVKSATIQVNTTVELSESITLQSGKVITKGSIVTVNDDTLKVVYADGRSEFASY